jgi:hypothetical protein
VPGKVFRIELLPAAHGDALWIEYGPSSRPHRIVIDGGPASTYEKGLRQRLLQLPAPREIDLFVVTHIDADHIDGPIILLREAEALGVQFKEIWFNGWKQLPKNVTGDEFAPLQGEFLGALLEARTGAWNRSSGGQAVFTAEARRELPDGARLTLLSPGPDQLKRLRARWVAAIRDFDAGDATEALKRLAERRDYRPPPAPPVFGPLTAGADRAAANGSSIAFLLEYEGAAVLLGADAHARVLAASLRALLQARGAAPGAALTLGAVKLPHHGSIGNVSDELLALLDCPRWLVSTNGAKFDHPDRGTAELIARHSRQPPEFFCNYRSPSTIRFADPQVPPRWRVRYADEPGLAGPGGGLLLDLLAPSAPAAKPAKKKAPPGKKKAAPARARPARARPAR